ncbi:LysM peptidoglycan-binding domain-containing protein [Myxococcus sp. MISCRS1]|uniref:LysM peptidoglycan-binding domain-containing protein n=1 Tax=Myxococcus TaxID=32 RepID=UPI001CBF28B9|nr:MULTISPECIES: LysM peptidoglycan-binding domain-containing protein [unclassified Myxococcus]MBZ4412041.1 LysM peptidoglycan-binding domain-containing protein [Myxococcus sp. XM-1-1-1]MCY0999067.1 LysM peptidoglycan-binding domain-containing protein [Myxococcus sp. MISCRS1]BDT30926.1 LysM peptidoglycan-binding domain-containing protein [Myxococcus sp. MH1]
MSVRNVSNRERDTRSYKIQERDTLTKIAKREGTTVDELARLNNLADPNKIRAGATLRLPGQQDGFEAAASTQNNQGLRRQQTQTPGDTFDAGTTAAAGITSNNVSGTQNGYRNIQDLGAFTRGGSNSEAAIIVGTSEGNRRPDGSTTSSYGGHTDPGNAKHNRGSFSYQGGGARSPEHADQIWNRELTNATPAYERAARAAGLDPNNALLASTFFDLHTQSPRAAQNFINREMPRLAQDPRGVTRDSLIDARVNAYRNDQGVLRAAGFDHSESRLRADQTRRETALVSALDARGYRTGNTDQAQPSNVPIPQPRPVSERPTSDTVLPDNVPIPRPRPSSERPVTTTGGATPTDMSDTAQVAAATDRAAVQTRTPWISQYDASQVERAGDKACFRAATAMARQAGANVTSVDQRIQVATSEGPNGITVDRAAAERGRNYIDQQLAAGKPVVVGVNHKTGRNVGNADGITDHFVVITGRGTDAQGRTYYTFNDPATRNQSRGADTNANNRFYVDPNTGNLTRPGPRDGYVVGRQFDVTMVRPNA